MLVVVSICNAQVAQFWEMKLKALGLKTVVPVSVTVVLFSPKLDAV